MLGWPSDEWDEEVRAIVVLRPDQEQVDEAQLRGHCRDLVAGYKVPKRVAIVADGTVPVSPTGKILKRELREHVRLALTRSHATVTSGTFGGVAGDEVTFDVRPVTRDDWTALERLFGRAGASNGCWCQYWLLGTEYHQRDRQLNRTALRVEIETSDGLAPGVVAISPEGEIVGWCRVTKRSQLPYVERRFGRRLSDGDDVWSLPCFFIARTWRGRGVMNRLVEAAAEMVSARGGVAEGYPIDTSKPGASRNRFPGTEAAFAAAGFVEVGRLSVAQVVVRPGRGD